MTGVVLCGGKSTRMGTDKGLLKEEEQTWAEMAARKFTALQLPVVISVNESQFPVYEQIFPAGQLVIDNECFAAKAPLFGLLSVHLRLPTEDLFVLACDIRDMTTDLMQQLHSECKRYDYEAYVFRTDRPQPLCGIYTAGGLKKIYQAFLDGGLTRFSMMHVLELLNTKYIPVEAENVQAFNNYNRPDEL